MSLNTLTDINWLAALVGAVIYFALGALWYAPGFLGRAWQDAIGWDPDEGPPQMATVSYLISFVAFFGVSVAVGMLAAATRTDTLVEGVILGLVVGLGVAVMHALVEANFDPHKPRPWSWWLINGSYYAVGVLVVAIIHSVWR